MAFERAIHPLALNRKNALFAGADEGGNNWALIVTLIENSKLTGTNPHTWLTSTLASLANGIQHRKSTSFCHTFTSSEDSVYENRKVIPANTIMLRLC